MENMFLAYADGTSPPKNLLRGNLLVMMDIKEIEESIEQLVKDISESAMPEALVDLLEDKCKKYDFALKVTYSYFEKEQNIEVKHLLALALIPCMQNDVGLRQFLTGRGWTQEDFDDLQYE